MENIFIKQIQEKGLDSIRLDWYYIGWINNSIKNDVDVEKLQEYVEQYKEACIYLNK